MCAYDNRKLGGFVVKKLKLYENGFIVQKDVVSGSASVPLNGRGKIISFSASARRRLREFLLTKHVADRLRVGFTLTLPFRADWAAEKEMDFFRSSINRFCVAFRRRWPSDGFVYRVELQHRGAPHLHAVLYTSVEDLALLQFALFSLWWSAIKGRVPFGRVADFRVFGVVVSPLPSVGGAIRYVADHASKRKQAQLGYRGKQWGVVCRKNFVDCSFSALWLFDDDFVRFSRLAVRVQRFRLLCPCVFGSKLVGRKHLARVNYVSCVSVNRALIRADFSLPWFSVPIRQRVLWSLVVPAWAWSVYGVPPFPLFHVEQFVIRSTMPNVIHC